MTEATERHDVELTLLVPAYNEASTIAATIAELADYMARELPHWRYEILVVDDGSQDETRETLEAQKQARPELRVVHHRRNFGRGRAIRTGFQHARGQYIVVLDADLSYDPPHIARLVEPLKRDEADITLASAYHPEGSVNNVPKGRALLSRWGNAVLSSSVYGRVSTVTCMVRGYRSDALEDLELISDDKDLHLEIIQKASLLGLRLKEIPGHLRWRDQRRAKRVKSSRLGQILPFFSMSSTIASHLVYNYVLRPSSVLTMPFVGMVLFSFVLFILLFANWMRRLFWDAPSVTVSAAYSTLRDTLLSGSLTVALMVVSLFFASIFAAFYFASQQNKKNFEEVYILMTRINARLKRLEKKVDR